MELEESEMVNRLNCNSSVVDSMSFVESETAFGNRENFHSENLSFNGTAPNPLSTVDSVTIGRTQSVSLGCTQSYYHGQVNYAQFISDPAPKLENEPGNKLRKFVSERKYILLIFMAFITLVFFGLALWYISLNSNSRLNHGSSKIESIEIDHENTIFGVAFLAFIMIIIIVGMIRKFVHIDIGDGDDRRPNIPIDASFCLGKQLVENPSADAIRMVTRSEWLAQEPENELTPLRLPATRVIIAHTATESCSSQGSCVFRVGGDGAVYVGRGWDYQGAHTKGYNTKSICIAFIGTFNKVTPPERQLDVAQKLIQEGVRMKKLDINYRLYGHRQLSSFLSPGDALYNIIKTWGHWTDKVE